MAKRAAILVLLVAIALVAGGAHALSCQTNGNSPTQGDGNSCVQYIRQLGDSQCCQFNCGGDFCTQMQAIGGARVLICGPCNRCTTCTRAGNALNNVLSQCVRNVAGTARCAGNDNADGFAFVLDRRNNAVGANATEGEVIEMVHDA